MAGTPTRRRLLVLLLLIFLAAQLLALGRMRARLRLVSTDLIS